MLIDAMREDHSRAYDISCECGEALREPYYNDDGKMRRYLWALAVGQMHILEWIMRKEARRERSK